MKKLLFFLMLAFLKFAGYSQSHPPTVIKDSLAIWELKSLHHQLNLDSNQAARFLTAVKSRLSSFESIGNDLSPEGRKMMIKTINKNFSIQLKEIFSVQQYDQYKSLQQKRKQLFTQRLSGNHVKVDEMEDAN